MSTEHEETDLPEVGEAWIEASGDEEGDSIVKVSLVAPLLGVDPEVDVVVVDREGEWVPMTLAYLREHYVRMPGRRPPLVRGERTVIEPARSRRWPAGVCVSSPEDEERERRLRSKAMLELGYAPLRPETWRAGQPEPILFWFERAWNPARFCDRAFEVSPRRIATAVRLLRDGGMRALYKGTARCRLCSKSLGSRDFTDGTFMWPEAAEHYVLGHAVWTSEIDLLLTGKPLLELGAVRLPPVFRERCREWR